MKAHYGSFTKGLLQDCGFSIHELEFNEEAVSKSLALLKIISDNEKIVRYFEISDWKRGGAETFVATAKLVVCNDKGEISERKFIAKAITTFFGLPLEIVAEKWLRRRNLLQRHVNTPYLFALHKGIFYEEFIPLSFNQVLRGKPSQKRVFVKELARISCALDFFGFSPIGIVSNLRTRDSNLFWIDFGQDLGDSSNQANRKAGDILQQEIRLTTDEREMFSSSYTATWNGLNSEFVTE